MYPFKGDNVYLENCWYVAAAANELNDGPIERTIMDHPVALFRIEDGSAISRDYRHDDSEFDEIMLESDLAVRQQDLDAVAEIEKHLARPWMLGQELLSKADGPAIQVRRKIQKQLDEEAAAASARLEDA